MLEPVVKDMAQAWEVLEEALIDCKEQCISVLIKLLDDVRSDLNGKNTNSKNSTRLNADFTLRYEWSCRRAHAALLSIIDSKKGANSEMLGRLL